MRVAVESLSAKALSFGLAGGQSIEIEQLSDVSGTSEIDGATVRARQLSARELIVSGLDWQLGELGRVRLEAPAALGALSLDGEMTDTADALPVLSGSAVLGAVHAQRASLELFGHRVAADLRATGISGEHTAAGGRATVASIELRNVQTALAGAFVRAGFARLERVQGSWDAGGLVAEASSVLIEKIEIRRGPIEVSIDRIEIPSGVAFRDGRVRAAVIRWGAAEIAIRDVTALAGDSSRGALPVDLRLLDGVNGRIHVDVTLDVTVPVIGRRKATHQFRIAVRDGTINYRDLERDLSMLEDAFLDLAVRDSALVLEFDVPLIPGVRRPILIWNLSEADLALARERLVRLRTIPNFVVPERTSDEPSKVALKSVAFDAIDIELAIAPGSGAEALAGAFQRPALGALVATGSIQHDAEQPPRRTQVSLSLAELALAIEALPAGGGSVSAGRFAIAAIEGGSLEFDGPHPRGLRATVRGIEIRDVDLSLPPR